MAERTISVPTYLVIAGLLVLLTFLTLAVSFIPLAPPWHLVLGLVIGAVKASLVALFFMHVILSGRLTWTFIVVTVFWVGILMVLTLGDYFTRGLMPYTPGH